MSKVILTRGIPCSGKTTWAEEYIKEHSEFVNLNRDDIRNMLYGPQYLRNGNFSRQKESFVTAVQINSALAASDNGKSIIISDTNLNAKTLKRWRDFAERQGLEFEIKDFEVSLKDALRRNELREDGIPARVIKRMFFKHKAETDDTHKVDQDSSNPHAVIFDIDGTLASHEGIRSPYDYTKVLQDTLHEDVKSMLDMMDEQGYNIIIMTGRDGVCREDTEQWLQNHDIDYTLLLQRAEGDTRPDYVIKRELFDTYVRDQYYIEFVFDDRDQVVHLWRSMGLRCFQVNYGDF